MFVTAALQATVETLKDTCASEFGMHSGSFVLWDYYEWTKQCRLDDRLQQSLAAANIWQGQAVLLEERVSEPKAGWFLIL